MKKSLVWVLLVLTYLLWGGCVTLRGEGEVGFKQSTEWAFYHRAIKDESDATSVSSLNLPPLIEWLFTPSKEGESGTETDSGSERSTESTSQPDN